MMPHTVPNRPTKGAVEPTVARKAMNRSTRSISRPTVTFITRSMRCCRLARILGVPSSPLAALRRHSRIAAAKTALIGSAGRCPTRSNKSSSEPPDQNVSSKLDADCRRRRRRITLSKITAHDQKEASNRSNKTILTIRSACPTRSRIESEWDTVPGSCEVSTGILGGPLWRHSGREHEDKAQLWRARLGQRLAQRGRDTAWPPVASDAGDDDIEMGEQLFVAADLLLCLKRGGADAGQRGEDGQIVLEARRGEIFDRTAPH